MGAFYSRQKSDRELGVGTTRTMIVMSAFAGLWIGLIVAVIAWAVGASSWWWLSPVVATLAFPFFISALRRPVFWSVASY